MNKKNHLSPLVHLYRERAAVLHVHGELAARLHEERAVGWVAEQHALLVSSKW